MLLAYAPVSKRRHIGITGVDDDVLQRYAEHLSRDLRQYRVRSCTQISRTDQDVERAVVVDLDTRAAHIEAGDCYRAYRLPYPIRA